ncbi:hypothetical protein [Mesorhizobium sp. SARCC-RB16n]|uniref:hypothetical protein n=1 Tax=Mesorhizobium sp. SARCC-RB16n TaxID=2116687 RepID=UPI00122EAD81|nr:hypothetical protein [Mesorhizobium sp. SARCC-RB16n]
MDILSGRHNRSKKCQAGWLSSPNSGKLSAAGTTRKLGRFASPQASLQNVNGSIHSHHRLDAKRRFARCEMPEDSAMPEPTLPIHSTDESISARLERSAKYLANVGDADLALLNCLCGVQEILLATCESDDLAERFPAQMPRLSRLIADACPIMAARGVMSPERLYWGMGRTNDLLAPTGAKLRIARINYVAIFVAELSIALHRQQLTLTGFDIFEDVFARSLSNDLAEPAPAIH